MTISIETSDVVPDIVTVDGHSVTTIVTEDVGDGTRDPITSVVTIDTGDTTTVTVNGADSAVLVDVNDAGVPGPPGIPGPQGVAGPAGGTNGMTFVQDIPSANWVIPHTFPYWPSVTVVDTGGNEIAATVYQADGLVTIEMDLPTAGRAYLI